MAGIIIFQFSLKSGEFPLKEDSIIKLLEQRTQLQLDWLSDSFYVSPEGEISITQVGKDYDYIFLSLMALISENIISLGGGFIKSSINHISYEFDTYEQFCDVYFSTMVRNARTLEILKYPYLIAKTMEGFEDIDPSPEWCQPL